MLTAISISSVAILTAGLASYFAKVKNNVTPKNPIVLKISMTLSTVLSVYAFFLLMTESHPNVDIAIAVTSILLALPTTVMFSYGLAKVITPIGNLQVRVGDQLPELKLGGARSITLVGKPVLLKFYRGAWCVYCSAELIAFESMKPKLAEYGIEIVAISNDTPEQQVKHKQRDNLTHTLISDPDLAVIRQFGVEHHKALGADSSKTINFFGVSLPLPWTMKVKPMAIPTTLLVDEAGKILWIDQSEDLRMRANEQMIMDAVQQHFKK